MDIFRKLMGVPASNYTIFRDFKRRVLDKSVEEVNTYSDLIVEPELIRERRQVVKIRFSLKERAKKTRLGSHIQEEESEVDTGVTQLRSKLIIQFNLSPTQTEQVLQEYSQDFILDKIAVIESSKNYQQGKVKNVAGYFLSALKNDYQSAKGSVDHVKQKKKEEERTLANLKMLERQVESIKKSYATYREKVIDKRITDLEENDKAEFMAQFYQHADISIKTILKLQRKRYTKTTILKSPPETFSSTSFIPESIWLDYPLH